MVIDGFVPSGNLTYSHGKSPWKWAMASMGGWVYWTIGMCHDAFLDVALTMVGMRCAMNIINYVYSYEFQLFLLISLLSLHVTMQMSLLLLCPCSHMFSLIFFTHYRCISLLIVIVIKPGGFTCLSFDPCRQAWSQQQSGRRKRDGTGGESPAEPYGWWLTVVSGVSRGNVQFQLGWIYPLRWLTKYILWHLPISIF